MQWITVRRCKPGCHCSRHHHQATLRYIGWKFYNCYPQKQNSKFGRFKWVVWVDPYQCLMWGTPLLELSSHQVAPTQRKDCFEQQQSKCIKQVTISAAKIKTIKSISHPGTWWTLKTAIWYNNMPQCALHVHITVPMCTCMSKSGPACPWAHLCIPMYSCVFLCINALQQHSIVYHSKQQNQVAWIHINRWIV